MKKYYFLILLCLIAIFLPNLSLAQSTPEQLETQRRLNEIEAKKATSSATVSADKKQSEITFVDGTVNSVGGATLFISTRFGNKTIYTTESTKFFNLDSKGKKLIGFGDLKIGETISIIGLSKESANGIAKIVVRDQNTKMKNFSLQGKVSEQKDGKLTIKNSSLETLPVVTVTLASTTIVKGKSKTLTTQELTSDKNIVVTGNIDDKGSLQASEVLSL